MPLVDVLLALARAERRYRVLVSNVCFPCRTGRKRVMENTKKALSSIPLLKTKAGPRDVDLWPQRLKEEYQSLIQVSEQQSIAVQMGSATGGLRPIELSSNGTDDSRVTSVRSASTFERTGNVGVCFVNKSSGQRYGFRFLFFTFDFIEITSGVARNFVWGGGGARSHIANVNNTKFI